METPVGEPLKPKAKKGDRTSSFSRDTGLDVSYAERTWRPVQTVVDIIQNHLDANTSVFEKKLLQSVGISEYKPDNESQQAYIGYLERLKYSRDPREQEDVYNDFCLQTLSHRFGPPPETIPSLAQLKEQIEPVTFELPEVRVKVSNGNGTKFVSYEEMKKVSDEWKVTGFRVYDTGSGFDSQLLGMIGASTKAESTGKRGGLGEGLKMSATHLVRVGADVRLLSRNEDVLWTAHAGKDDDNRVEFTGRQRVQPNPSSTGSITDVDFTLATFDKRQREEVVSALDPRRGEGIGKYILDYRGSEFIGISGQTCNIHTLGVPEGRVYVKGLLVMDHKPNEKTDLLASYNIGDKWAIGGRDRKTIHPHVLREHILQAIKDLRSVPEMTYILSEAKSGQYYQEHSLLTSRLDITFYQKEQWKQAIATAFTFTPEKMIFATQSLSVNEEAQATSLGYKVIRIPDSKTNMLDFIEKVYRGDHIVTIDQLQKQIRRSSSEQKRIGQYSEELSPQTQEILAGFKGSFLQLLNKTLVSSALDTAKGRNSPLFNMMDIEKFGNLRIKKAPAGMNMIKGTSFSYELSSNTLFVTEDEISANFSNLVDSYIAFLLPLTKSSGFDGKTQYVLTEMIGHALANIREDGFGPVVLERLKDLPIPDRRVTYSPERRSQDDKLIDFYANIAKINQGGVGKEEVEETLRAMVISMPDTLGEVPRKETKLSKLFKNVVSDKVITFSGIISGTNTATVDTEDRGILPPGIKPGDLRKRLNTLFYFNNELYTLDVTTLSLVKGPRITEQEKEYAASKVPNKKYKSLFSVIPVGKFFDVFGKTDDKYIPTALDKAFTISRNAPYEIREVGGDIARSSFSLFKDTYLPFDLKDGEQITIRFHPDSINHAILVTKQGENTIMQNVYPNGSIEPIAKAGSLSSGETLVEYQTFTNILRLEKNGNVSVSISRSEPKLAREAVAETNRGKNFLSANITLDYGGEIWRDPKRILIDAMQNHLDAQKGYPQMSFSVVNPQNDIRLVSEEELAQMDKTWEIVGVRIEDEGKGYTTPYLLTLGKTTKGETDAGKFGEGLKMFCASAVRQGIGVELQSRDWVATPTAFTQRIQDYETNQEKVYNMLGYSMQWLEQEHKGSYTHFSVIPSLSSSQTQITSQQLQEYAQKMQARSTWIDWIDILDPRQIDQQGKRGIERFVLPIDERHQNSSVKLLSNRPGEIFEKGLLITGESAIPFMFGYNISESIINTRERNAYSEELLSDYLRDFYQRLTDPSIMRKILETARDNPENVYQEYRIIADNNFIPSEASMALWRKTYYEVFGNTAILSSRAEKNRLTGKTNGRRDNVARISEYLDPDVRELKYAEENEIHLGSANLIHLPEELSALLFDRVYTSKDFFKALDEEGIPLLPDEKGQLYTFMRKANERILTILESIDSNPERRQVLEKIVASSVLSARKGQLQLMGEDDVHVMYPIFPAEGKVTNDNDKVTVYLNQQILQHEVSLLGTYPHEIAHFLSGKADYTLDFQRFLMLLAINGQQRYLN